MATPTKTINSAVVSLKLPTKVGALITFAQGIVQGMKGNPSFPAPMPTLAAVEAAIADLQVAETAALGRQKGAVATRNEKRVVLIGLLRQLKAYAQAQADLSPENGGSIIQSGGFAVRKPIARRPRAFLAKPGPVSGTVKVTAVTAGHRASYEWEYSVDGGKTWIPVPPTLQAKTTVSGLQPGSTVQFRYRAVTKAGAADWSQPVSLMVL